MKRILSAALSAGLLIACAGCQTAQSAVQPAPSTLAQADVVESFSVQPVPFAPPQEDGPVYRELAAGPKTGGQKKADPLPVSDGEFELPFSFELDSIGAGKTVCVGGPITISGDLVYQIEVTAKTGEGLFVALNPADNVTAYDNSGWGWHQHYGSLGTDGCVVGAAFWSVDWSDGPTKKPTDEWYVYVGSYGSKLTGVSGTLTQQQ